MRQMYLTGKECSGEKLPEKKEQIPNYARWISIQVCYVKNGSAENGGKE